MLRVTTIRIIYTRSIGQKAQSGQKAQLHRNPKEPSLEKPQVKPKIRVSTRECSKEQLKPQQPKQQQSVLQKVKDLWNHPAGPTTIFFWAPLSKWGLVLAGLADLGKHPSKLSASQAIALVVSASIWCRYSTVIIPKNWLLFSVNFFVVFSQAIQLLRLYTYTHYTESKMKK